MIETLSKMPNYKPIDVLVSQLDRSAIKSMIQYRKEGMIGDLFIDSGAFSFHTGKATLDLEEYIEFLNKMDDEIFVCAQVDTIPGKFGQPKSKQDYEESAQKSWDNYLYMRTKLKSPKKLTPVFHYGESFDALKRILDYRDENGEPIDYIGISPANDTSQKTKDIYMKEVYDFIANSNNPNVKTHLYGMTSISGLSKVPAYSADSISHRHISGYNKIWVPEFGVISLSKRTRTSRSKSSMSFVDTADPESVQRLKNYIEGLGVTLEECEESSSTRCAVTMYSIMELLKANPYKPENVTRSKKLFQI